MKLKRKFNKSLVSPSLNKATTFLLLVLFPLSSLADPMVDGLTLPPASFTHIQDYDMLVKLGLDGYGGAWCYDTHANAILISAPAKERAMCDIKLKYESERIKYRNKLEIDNLKLRITTLESEHSQILAIKDREIERLTSAIAKVPNDHTIWWASGSFLVGVLVTVGVVLAVK